MNKESSEGKVVSKKALVECPSPKDVDKYTKNVLKEQYELHKNYVKQRMESSDRLGVKFRLPSIPEDISENIIK